MAREMYQHNRLLDGCFRLLSLQCELSDQETLSYRLETFNLVNAPAYIALSYTWGAPQTTTNTINVNGEPFEVRENLVSFLKALKTNGPPKEFESAPEYFWADAICIDQSNLEERNIQVAKMGMIFSQAKFVVAWLGEPVDDMSKDIMDLFDSFEPYNHPSRGRAIEFGGSVLELDTTGEEDNPYPSRLDREVPPLPGSRYALLLHDYWNRMWIVQEVLLAQHLIVMCGLKTCHWEKFHLAVLVYSDKLYGADSVILLAKMWSRQLRRKLYGDSVRLFGQAGPAISSIPYPLHFLADVIERRCLDPRDKVFGMLGLGHLEPLDGIQPLIPDYNMTNREVFEMVLRHINEFNAYHHQQAEKTWFEEFFVWNLAFSLELQPVSVIDSPEFIAFFGGHALKRPTFWLPISHLFGS